MKVAIIQLSVLVQSIDHVSLHSLDEALINAQFRIIPHLIVNGRVLLDSACTFDYKWKTDTSMLKLKGTENKIGLGLNATAIK